MHQKAHVRIFYSLLILSLLEAFLWSIPLLDEPASVHEYYARETSNFLRTDGHFPPTPVRGLDLSLIDLAVKEQTKAFKAWSERLAEGKQLQPPACQNRDSVASLTSSRGDSASVDLACSSTDSDEAAAAGGRLVVV
jgi:hypothetical protein